MTQTLPALTPQYPDLSGKVTLVTGGSKGIVAATVRALAANGARVAVNGRDAAALNAIVAEILDAGAEAIAVPADVCHAEQIETMRERVEAELGQVEVLIPFAGGFTSYVTVHETSEQDWRAVIDSNLTATFLCLKAFLPAMIERREGAIVTMASNAARHLDTTLTASYAAAKAGVVQLTRHTAREVGKYGIRVNCVAPGTTHTERVDRILPREVHDELVARTPLGRLGQPEESAMAALFLASQAASGYLTGVTIDISGGRVML
jgi:3-oxoacyl-[acyl-carrier protein] reductase